MKADWKSTKEIKPIAAAPELLEAAKAMFMVISRERWYTPKQREEFAAIIAKADDSTNKK